MEIREEIRAQKEDRLSRIDYISPILHTKMGINDGRYLANSCSACVAPNLLIKRRQKLACSQNKKKKTRIEKAPETL